MPTPKNSSRNLVKKTGANCPHNTWCKGPKS